MQTISEKLKIIYRAELFSPNSIEKDRLILDAVVSRIDTDALDNQAKEVFLSMGRLPETLAFLKKQEDNGALVINSGYGVERCARCVVESLLRAKGLPLAPTKGNKGYWLKRGDAAAQSSQDIVYVPTQDALDDAIRSFKRRGISSYTVSAHVEGDLIKFYGVRETSFFRFFYPTDDGDSKFGDEQRNGIAHHFKFDVEALKRDADNAAGIVGIDVYGGDCIITPQGEYKIIDFNDWPSFSRCREEAADAIVERIWKKVLKNY